MPLHNYSNAVVIELCIIIQVNSLYLVHRSFMLNQMAKVRDSHFIRSKFWHGQSVATDYLCHETCHWKFFIRSGSCMYRRECACGWELVCMVVFLVCWHVNVNMCTYIWVWCCNWAQYPLICIPIVHAGVTECSWAGTDVKILEKFTAQKDRATGGKGSATEPEWSNCRTVAEFQPRAIGPSGDSLSSIALYVTLIPCR